MISHLETTSDYSMRVAVQGDCINPEIKYVEDKNKKYIILDLKEKYNGFLNLEIKVLANEKYKSISNGSLEYFYGPRQDFLNVSSVFKVITQEEICIFQEHCMKSFRYAKIEVPESWGEKGKDWIVNKVFLKLEMRDVKDIGYFKCSDNLINNIWEVGANTTHLCMAPHRYGNAYRKLLAQERVDFVDSWRGEISDYVLLDGPRRDKEVWVGDLLPEVRCAWYIFKDSEVIKNSIKIFTDQQREDGFLPASSVSYQYFPEYCCWFVIVLKEYVLLSGDIKFLEEIWDNYRKLMKWLESLLGDSIMMELGVMQTWAWTLARKGKITSSQCVLYNAYMCASQLEDWMNNEEEKNIYEEKAKVLKKCIQQGAWDLEEKAFLNVAETKENKSYSLDANAFSIIYEIAEGDQINNILEFLSAKLWGDFGSHVLYPKEALNEKNWIHNNHIWPFVVSFEVEARLIAEDYKGAMELIKRCWGNMINQGSKTYWEIVDGATGEFMTQRLIEADDDRDTWNSYCHGWSAGISYLLQAYVAGIKAIKPGFKEFSIEPKPMGLDTVQAVIPTPNGEIYIDYERQSGKKSYIGSITVPEGTTGKLCSGNNTLIIRDAVTDSYGNYVLNNGKYTFSFEEGA
jgi:hypothetical protein